MLVHKGKSKHFRVVRPVKHRRLSPLCHRGCHSMQILFQGRIRLQGPGKRPSLLSGRERETWSSQCYNQLTHWDSWCDRLRLGHHFLLYCPHRRIPQRSWGKCPPEAFGRFPVLLKKTVSNHFSFKAATDKLLMIPLGSLTSGTLRIVLLELESGFFFFFLRKSSLLFTTLLWD